MVNLSLFATSQSAIWASVATNEAQRAKRLKMRQMAERNRERMSKMRHSRSSTSDASNSSQEDLGTAARVSCNESRTSPLVQNNTNKTSSRHHVETRDDSFITSEVTLQLRSNKPRVKLISSPQPVLQKRERNSTESVDSPPPNSLADSYQSIDELKA
ncbi:uncharacterized protein LOC142344256 [Convolutriloba macropyga]|uniref:uncharacterized protein LOC142344256 n=1 Tax=Convolutriloba macropyga TaxID=536237 RepID=UPI003F5280E4